MGYTDKMKQWIICITYVLATLVMSDGAVLACEVDSPAAVEKNIQKEVAVQNELLEDCMSISMDELVEHLKETKAIGFFTKLAIRSDVIGFQDEVQKMRKKNQLKEKMGSVKASFDGLLLKIMALLEKDPDLSKKIYLARHSIFKSLMEVKT